jgi:hypothetical protein
MTASRLAIANIENSTLDSNNLPLLVRNNIVKSADLLVSQSMYYLQLVSKKEGYYVSDKTPLNRNVTKIGTLSDTCECLITRNGPNTSLSITDQPSISMISTVHCIIYLDINSQQIRNEFNKVEHGSTIRVVDNGSKYFTFVISKEGAKKVSRILSEGVTVFPGDLICLGIGAIGISNKYSVVTTQDLSDACIVFRVSSSQYE